MNLIFRMCMLTSLILLNCCGVKDPDISEAKNGEKIVMPNFGAFDSVLNLVPLENAREEKFIGSFVFHNPDAGHKLLMQALQKSGEIKFLKFQQSQKFHEYKKQFDDHAKFLQDLETFEVSIEFKSQMQQQVSSTLKELMQNSQEMTRALCEKALWHTATSDLLLENEFYEPPLILEECHGFYKENGFLDPATDSACRNSSDGKNYLPCFWGKTGVHNTRLIVANWNTLDEDEEEQLGWTPENAYKNLVANNSMKNFRQSGSFESEISYFQILEEGVVEYSSTLFKQNRDLLEAIFKNRLGKSLADYLFLEGKSLGFETTSRVPKQLFEASVRKTNLFSGLIEKDTILNTPAQLEDKQRRIAEQQRMRDELLKIGIQFDQARINSSHFLAENKVSLAALSPVIFAITAKDGMTQMTVTLPQAYAIRACYDSVTFEKKECPPTSTDWKEEKGTLDWDPETGGLKVRIPIENPKDFGLQCTHPKEGSDSSHAEEPKKPQFQLIPDEKLIGKDLYFEIYPRKFKGSLDTITGKIEIQDKEQTVYEGSLSLFKEYVL